MSLFKPHIIPFYRIAKVLWAISNLLLFVVCSPAPGALSSDFPPSC